MRSGTLVLSLYRQSLALLTPFAPLVLWQRARAGKEMPGRLRERRGFASIARPSGPLIWVHGASVGEIISITPLAAALAARGFQVLVTSGTTTSAAVAAERLPRGVIHQFVPLDLPSYVDRFLKHWRPNLALFAESELWPNLLTATHRAQSPIVIVNGRMSERSFARWKRRRRSAEALLAHVDQCLVQSPREAARFTDLGAHRVAITGNLKFDAPPLPADPQRLAALQEAIAGRRVAIAASTHSGEEEIVARAHLLARREVPDLLTIIVPRHPQRGSEIKTQMTQLSLRAGRRSKGVLPSAKFDVYVADTIGELGLFYRLADVVFMGGSMVEHGGQNPIEAAKLGKPVLHGSHVQNFADIYALLDRGGGALPVGSAEALGHAVGVIGSDTELQRTMGASATRSVTQLGGALARTLEALEPYLIQLRLG